MKTKSWPYGTRVAVLIEGVDVGWKLAVVVARHVLAQGEVTVMLCKRSDIETMTRPPALGESREIEFRAGGPTGGYWAVVDEPVPAGATSC